MYYLGIDLGGTNIAAGIVSEDYKIIKKGSVPTVANREPESIVDDMASLCKQLIAEAGLTVEDIAGAGIAAPGTVNCELGIVEEANNLPFLNFPIVALLSEKTGIKRVFIENDANAAAMAESVMGAAAGTDISVMITLGTGVGGGVILNGKVFSGFNHAGAELGHIVIEHNGRPCSCGRRGCWEAYSSATALIQMTREKLIECRENGRATVIEELIEGDLDRVSGKTAFLAQKQGDEVGIEIVDTYLSYLACGLANIVNIFQPNMLTIGGGISYEGDNLLNPLKERVFKEVYNHNAAPEKLTEMKLATLRNDAGILGAAALAL